MSIANKPGSPGDSRPPSPGSPFPSPFSAELSSAPSAPTHFRWVIVAMLCAVAMVLYIDRVNLMVAITSIQDEFALSDIACGDILSAFLFGYAVGLVPGGWLADRFGAHRLLSASVVSWGVITLLTACVRPQPPGTWPEATDALFVLRFLLGVCEACAWPAFGRAMAHWMRPSERALASGLVHTGSGVGGTFAPILVAWIVLHLGWREAFLTSGLITFGAALWWWWQATDDPSQHPRVSEAELALITAERTLARPEPLNLAWFKRLAVSRNGYLLCLSEFFYGLGGFFFLTWFYTYFTKVREVDEMYSGMLSSCNYVALAVAAPIGGLVCDRCVRRWGYRWGRRTVPLVCIVLSGACTAIAPTIEHPLASAAVFAVSCGFMYAAAPAFWSTLIDITRQGTGILGGMMNGAGSLGGALGTMWFARLLPHLGYERSIQCAGAMAVVSGLIWLGLDASRPIDAALETCAARKEIM